MTAELGIENFEIYANGLDHPECLAFDREGRLWAGGEAGQVYRIPAGGAPEIVAEITARFAPDSTLSPCEGRVSRMITPPKGRASPAAFRREASRRSIRGSDANML